MFDPCLCYVGHHTSWEFADPVIEGYELRNVAGHLVNCQFLKTSLSLCGICMLVKFLQDIVFILSRSFSRVVDQANQKMHRLILQCRYLPVSSFGPQLCELHQFRSFEIGVVNLVCVQPVIEQDKYFRFDIWEFQDLDFSFRSLPVIEYDFKVG